MNYCVNKNRQFVTNTLPYYDYYRVLVVSTWLVCHKSQTIQFQKYQCGGEKSIQIASLCWQLDFIIQVSLLLSLHNNV